MKVLITGGAGFIGSHLAEYLLRLGHTVALIDNFDTFYSPVEKGENVNGALRSGQFDLCRVDICDLEELRRVFKAQAPDAVVHLAALAGVRPSFERPLDYVRVNVAGTAAVLDACRHSSVRRMVFASSSSIYGATCRAPFREDDVDNRPVSPYAATKLAGEQLCHAYAALGKLSIVCLRLFSVFGPRQRPDLAIRKFIDTIVQGQPITVLGDGKTSRDYTYVDDVVHGFAAALDVDCQFEAINLGGSRPVSLNEVIACLEELIGTKAIILHTDAHSGDVPLTCADVEKASRLLGWKAETPFRRGLEESVAWSTSRVLAAAQQVA